MPTPKTTIHPSKATVVRTVSKIYTEIKSSSQKRGLLMDAVHEFKCIHQVLKIIDFPDESSKWYPLVVSEWSWFGKNIPHSAQLLLAIAFIYMHEELAFTNEGKFNLFMLKSFLTSINRQNVAKELKTTYFENITLENGCVHLDEMNKTYNVSYSLMKTDISCEIVTSEKMGRPVIVINKQAYYQSSGTNSESRGTIFPFFGISSLDWIVKPVTGILDPTSDIIQLIKFYLNGVHLELTEDVKEFLVNSLKYIDKENKFYQIITKLLNRIKLNEQEKEEILYNSNTVIDEARIAQMKNIFGEEVYNIFNEIDIQSLSSDGLKILTRFGDLKGLITSFLLGFGIWEENVILKEKITNWINNNRAAKQIADSIEHDIDQSNYAVDKLKDIKSFKENIIGKFRKNLKSEDPPFEEFTDDEKFVLREAFNKMELSPYEDFNNEDFDNFTNNKISAEKIALIKDKFFYLCINGIAQRDDENEFLIHLDGEIHKKLGIKHLEDKEKVNCYLFKRKVSYLERWQQNERICLMIDQSTFS